MEEHELTAKQRKWLEASRKIGPGAMTRTERETLERLYAGMLPKEQQELADYIQATFGKEEDDKEPREQEPTQRMERKVWNQPSSGLVSVLSKSQAPGRKPPGDKS